MIDVEVMARVCHEAVRAIQVAYDQPDPSASWDEAPEWQREATVAGVMHALAGSTVEEIHESWCEGRRAEGWIYGPEKNAELKTHPCLVDYDKLPEAERVKDRLIHAITNTLVDA